MRERVVLDLEATCWDARDPVLASIQRQETEIIEIGAVRESDGAELRRFVKPRRHPTLSAFCTELTGITQADVDGGTDFAAAYADLLAFAGGDEDLVLASWGAYDHQQLVLECGRNGIELPVWTPLNVKALFAKREKQRVGLGRAIELVGGTFAGTPHRALDDARNVAWILAFLEGAARDPAGRGGGS